MPDTALILGSKKERKILGYLFTRGNTSSWTKISDQAIIFINSWKSIVFELSESIWKHYIHSSLFRRIHLLPILSHPVHLQSFLHQFLVKSTKKGNLSNLNIYFTHSDHFIMHAKRSRLTLILALTIIKENIIWLPYASTNIF